MPFRNLARILLGLAAVAAVLTAPIVHAAAGRSTGAAKSAKRFELGAQNNPIGSKGRTLALSKVIIPAGARLALHHHPGTQVAYVASGNLTYSVKSGSVNVMTGAADTGTAKVVLRICAGHTGVIHPGEWIVEDPTIIHSGMNRGSRPVVIYLATLFPIGSPPAIPNK